MVIAGTIGATVGALVAYAIGYWGGRPIILRWGRWSRITADDLDRIEAFFASRGRWPRSIGRLIPVVRSLVSFGAGVGRMPIVPFVVYTFLGSLPFTFVLVFVGVQLGANWETIGAVLKQFEYLILGILGWSLPLPSCGSASSGRAGGGAAPDYGRSEASCVSRRGRVGEAWSPMPYAGTTEARDLAGRGGRSSLAS